MVLMRNMSRVFWELICEGALSAWRTPGMAKERRRREVRGRKRDLACVAA